MPKRVYPSDVYEQAKSVLDAWCQTDDQLTFGALNTGALTMDVNRARGIDESLTNLENKLTDLRNQRDEVNLILWDRVKRVRAGFKATYGDDSSQLEMVGGTRLSDRKTMRRTATPVQ
jgi:hypothetical protein